jgi:hypothetical protein
MPLIVRTRFSIISLSQRRLPEDLPSDYYALYLIGPLIDLGELRVSNVPLQREVLPVARSTVHLQCVDRCLHRYVGRPHLRHCGLLGVRASRITKSGRPMGQEPRRLYVRGHVRQHPLDALKRGDRTPELSTVASIADCCLERGPGYPDGQSRNPNTPRVKGA